MSLDIFASIKPALTFSFRSSAYCLRVISRTSRLVNVGILRFLLLVLGMDIESNELFPVQMHRDGFLSGMSFGRENYATLGAAH